MKNRFLKNRHEVSGLIFLLCAVFLFAAAAGCGVPKHMRVRSGVDPRYQDDDVRFRNTYYFRVFDPENGTETATNGIGVSKIQKDSLYRFRMTGKAHSLSNKVHFESGILHEDEIDPFGAAVVYDKKLGRHRFVSQFDTKQEVVRNQQYAEIAKLMDLFEEVSKKVGTDTNTTALENIQTAYATQITNTIQNIKIPGATIDPDPTTINPGEEKKVNNTRKGFQILGPQGWKTFEQDERLLMAMTSSGKPLISGMRELSNRILNEQPNASETLLPLVKELLKISMAERYLDSVEPDQNMQDVIGETLAELQGNKGGITK